MIHLGLTGWPIANSLSPKLQNAALQAVGVNGDYCLYPVHPSQPEKLDVLLDMLRSRDMTGLNVTIPHKQTVMPMLDDLTPSARMIGAVNTIFLSGSRLVGHNTDGPGFWVDLRQKNEKACNTPGNALVLGAGGSARAVIWALIGMSWRVTVAARNLTQAKVLEIYFNQRFGDGKIRSILLDADSLLPLIKNTGLVVNTTPIGMNPNIDISPWPNELPLPPDAFIYDLVYNPHPTLFVRQARNRGLGAANGLGMLIEQAALAFEIWTGKAASRAIMLSAISSVSNDAGEFLFTKTPEE